MIILVQRTKHGDKEPIQQRRGEESFRWHLLFILHWAPCVQLLFKKNIIFVQSGQKAACAQAL